MNETSKSLPVRKRLGHFPKFLHGRGLDIGCGTDRLRIPNGTVDGWDLPQGDAQLLAAIPDASYDFVYSSHYLEHMRDVRVSLSNWVRVLKPSGSLFVVVPDYVIYEHLRFPSQYNPDHKHSFSIDLTRQRVGRANHHHIGSDIIPLLAMLGATVVNVALEDDQYDYSAGDVDQTMLGALAQIRIVARKSVSP